MLDWKRKLAALIVALAASPLLLAGNCESDLGDDDTPNDTGPASPDPTPQPPPDTPQPP